MIIFFQMYAGDDEQQINYRQHKFFVKLREIFFIHYMLWWNLKEILWRNIEHFLKKPIKENLEIPEMK